MKRVCLRKILHSPHVSHIIFTGISRKSRYRVVSPSSRFAPLGIFALGCSTRGSFRSLIVGLFSLIFSQAHRLKACKFVTSFNGSDKNKFITGLKFVSININSIRGKKLELLAFLDFHQPQIVAIQETKIDSSISTSELFPESCPYNVYRKDRTLDGGGVMLLIHKDISHMPITELENDSESIWVKVFANKTSHFAASWYRPPGGDLEKLDSQLKSLKNSLKRLRIYIKAINPPQSIFWGTSTFVTLFGQTDSANQVHH